MECFDMRVRSSVGRLNAVVPAGDIDQVANLLLELNLLLFLADYEIIANT